MTAIVNASILVAEARNNLDRANAEHKKATDHHDAVQARIQGLLGEKSGIASARVAGRGDDFADGARLALVSLDLEGLHELHAQAIADVTAAQVNVQQASHQLAIAEQAAARTEDEELLTRLVPHAPRLADLLGETVAEMKAVARRLGTRERFAPSPALVQELRRLELTVGSRQ